MVQAIDKLKQVFHINDSSKRRRSSVEQQRKASSDSTGPQGRFSSDVPSAVRVLPAQVNPTDTIDAQPILQNSRSSLSRDVRASLDGYPSDGQRHPATANQGSPRQRLSVTGNDVDTNDRRIQADATAQGQVRSGAQSSLPHRAGPQSDRANGAAAYRDGGNSQSLETAAKPTAVRFQQQDSNAPITGDTQNSRRFSVARKPIGEPAQPDMSGESSEYAGTLPSESAAKTSTQATGPLRDATVNREGIKDLPEGTVFTGNSTDTTITQTMAPAVTHERIDQHIHEEKIEEIHRDIHTHDVYHRILPVVDVQVLPARHYVPADDGTLVEIARNQLADLGLHDQGWAVTKTPLPNNAALSGPRRFTAKEFADGEGSAEQFRDKDGVLRQKTTWIHPPELEQTHRPPGPFEEISFP